MDTSRWGRVKSPSPLVWTPTGYAGFYGQFFLKGGGGVADHGYIHLVEAFTETFHPDSQIIGHRYLPPHCSPCLPPSSPLKFPFACRLPNQLTDYSLSIIYLSGMLLNLPNFSPCCYLFSPPYLHPPANLLCPVCPVCQIRQTPCAAMVSVGTLRQK